MTIAERVLRDYEQGDEIPYDWEEYMEARGGKPDLEFAKGLSDDYERMLIARYIFLDGSALIVDVTESHNSDGIALPELMIN